jgi:hypothetical protein
MASKFVEREVVDVRADKVRRGVIVQLEETRVLVAYVTSTDRTTDMSREWPHVKVDPKQRLHVTLELLNVSFFYPGNVRWFELGDVLPRKARRVPLDVQAAVKTMMARQQELDDAARQGGGGE